MINITFFTQANPYYRLLWLLQKTKNVSAHKKYKNAKILRIVS